MKNILYIITPSRFLQYFTEFIIHKQQLGFTVNTYMVENIGNGTFGDIKAFLDKESEKIQDDYYVLLGGNATLVPSDIVVYKTKGARYTDSSYSRSKDGAHWRSVGRFPANDENQIKNMCATAISYEEHSISYLDSVTMIAATKGNIQKTKNISVGLKVQMASVTECYTDTEGRNEIIDHINANTDCFINYMGHGASDSWCLKILPSSIFENITSDDIPKFVFRYPHILSWACNTADIGNIKCLGTQFLKNGAVSFWGACGITWGNENRQMAEDFWNAYKDTTNCPEHIGEIYLALYKRYSGTYKGCLRYMLLGDPTLKIK